MKHKKQRNVGILFEVLNHAVLNEIAKSHDKTAKAIFKVIKKHFMSETQVSKAYKIYSQLLYSEARNPYYATRFFSNLMKEYHNNVDAATLYKENTQLLEDISKVCDRKKIMKISVPNYKLFASFNILVNEDNIRYGGQYLSSRDRMVCEQNVCVKNNCLCKHFSCKIFFVKNSFCEQKIFYGKKQFRIFYDIDIN